MQIDGACGGAEMWTRALVRNLYGLRVGTDDEDGHLGPGHTPVGAEAAPLPRVGAPGDRPHFVDARFLAYWRAHGGLARNGYPISDAFEQRLEDGQTRPETSSSASRNLMSTR